jgi:hypothetical protein
MRALSVPRYVAVGVLESLWHFAAAYADDGDLGKFSDEDIAEFIGWDDAKMLLSALESTGWLDGRQIHDWTEHAPDYIKKRLARRTTADSGGQRRPTEPIPNRTDTKPRSRSIDIDSGDLDQKCIDPDQIEALKPVIRQVATVLRNGQTRGRLPDRDRDEAIKLAWLSANRFSEDWLQDALEGVRRKKPKKPAAYLHRSLQNACEKLGTNLGAELKRLTIERKP